MVERCVVFLDKSVYAPGENITGRVHCHFLYDNDVRNIYLRFKGIAKVAWSAGKYSNYSEEELYFEMESPLLQDRTNFPPGDYDYPFSFSLKGNIPSSAIGQFGTIKYTVTAVVDRPLAIDYKYEQQITVVSTRLHSNDYAEPIQFREDHTPGWTLFSTGPVRATISLPKRIFSVDEMVTYTAKLENYSNVGVKEVRFCLVQGFNYYVQGNTKESKDFVGQEFGIIDSSVKPTGNKSWDLELRIPRAMFAGSLDFCRIMKVFWELRGEVVLPFPNTNFKFKVPIYVGAPENS